MTKSILTITTALAAAFALSACDADSTSALAPTQNLLNLGTTSAAAASNGLPFAGDLEELDPTGDSITVNFTSANLGVASDAPGTAGAVTADALTIMTDGPGEDGAIATGTLGGRAFTVFTDPGDFAGLLVTFDDNGDVLESANPYLSEMLSQAGPFAFEDRPLLLPLATVINAGQMDEAQTGIGYTVVGLQTNPEVLNAITTGGVRYSGLLMASGNSFDAVTGDALSTNQSVYGGVNLTANFETDRIGGNIFVSNIARGGFDLQLQETDIEGNGFATTANTVFGCADGMICTSNTEIGGAFYGEEAETLAGLVTFDLSATDTETGAGEQLVGVGGYTAFEGGFPIGIGGDF